MSTFVASRPARASGLVFLLASACATSAPQRRVDPEVGADRPSTAGEGRTESGEPSGTTESYRDGLERAREALAGATTPTERRAAGAELVASARAEGRGLDAAFVLIALHRAEAVPAQRRAHEAGLIELADQALSPREVRVLLESDGVPDPVREHLAYKVALLRLHAGDAAAGRELLDDYLERFPRGVYAERARARLERLDALARVEPRTVGVLLPMSGRKAAYGRLARQALDLAMEGSALRLVVKDTKNDEATTMRAVEALVVEEGAIALLGPALSDVSRAAAVMAQRLGVPLLSVSVAEDLPGYGPWVFQNSFTTRDQAEALADYATKILGFSRFAILHPRHPYGEGLRDQFWSAVRERGGEVTAVESYEANATTFARPVKRLVGRHEPRRRLDYRQEVEACDEERDAYRQARCRDEVVKNLPPLIDFDAVFIPDYARNVRMLAAALAVEDVIVEQDPRRLRVIRKSLGREPEVVTLLGPNGWNSPKITESTGRTVENAVFVDGFFASADDERTARFVNAYRKRYGGATPRLFPEALMYDSARIVRSLIETRQPTTRAGFREALLAVEQFPGVTGDTSFSGRTHAQKVLRVLTIKNGAIEVIPPPDAPAPGAPSAARPAR